MKSRAAKILVGAASLLVLTVTASAGGKNLKFFPKEMSDKDLKAEMKLMKRSLGTGCELCHQMVPRDFTVDTDKKKGTRGMLALTKSITEKEFPKIFGKGGDDDEGEHEHGPKKATCFMCHKGQEKVQMTPPKPEMEKKFNDKIARGKHKATVEAMKKMVETLNAEYFTWKDAPKATCWMCHRGKGEFHLNPPKATEDDENDEAPAKKAPEAKPEGEKKAD